MSDPGELSNKVNLWITAVKQLTMDEPVDVIAG